METAQPPTNQSGASRPIGGIVCLVLSVPLFLGAVSWLGVLALIDSHAERLPKFAYVPGMIQIVVAALFALTGLLYLRKSTRAKLLLGIAVASFLFELPIVIFAFAGFVAAAS